jgi:hypothetical protein
MIWVHAIGGATPAIGKDISVKSDVPAAGPDAAAMAGVLSDAPTEKDELGRGRYVVALADLALTADTPYVIAVYGAWGSGKTSLMSQMRRRLEPGFDLEPEKVHGESRLRTSTAFVSGAGRHPGG